MAEPEPRQVIVTLDDGGLDALSDTVGALRAAGLEVAEVLEVLGQVLGTWSEPSLDALLEIDGVASVEESGPVGLL